MGDWNIKENESLRKEVNSLKQEIRTYENMVDGVSTVGGMEFFIRCCLDSDKFDDLCDRLLGDTQL